METLLSLRGVGKGYGAGAARTDVLRNVDIDVREGEVVAIVGYSGSGKTTLMSLMAGLLTPDVGTIQMAGQAVTGPSTSRGLVFQNYSLLPWFSVAENVRLAIDAAFPDAPPDEKEQRTEAVLRLVKLLPARDKKPAQLSGGMRQRVAVARALSMEPRVLLLDEPLSALDALTRATLQDELERIRAETGRTIVLVTNDVDEAILLADRIVPLSHGPSATMGPSIDVNLPRPRDRRTLARNPDAKAIRLAVLTYLLGPGRKGRNEASS